MSEPLAIPDAERRLRQLLEQSASSRGHVSPAEVLAAFKTFADEAVVCTSDSLLFEWGIFTFTGQPVMHVSFVRQFRVQEPQDEDPELWQVHCELLHEPTDSLVRTGRSHFWSDHY